MSCSHVVQAAAVSDEVQGRSESSGAQRGRGQAEDEAKQDKSEAPECSECSEQHRHGTAERAPERRLSGQTHRGTKLQKERILGRPKQSVSNMSLFLSSASLMKTQLKSANFQKKSAK